MQINIKIDGLDAALSALEGFSTRRMNAAIATALSRTASDTKAALQREMRDSFDRPTPFTLNSVFVKRATATDLTAEVGIKDDQAGTRPAQRWIRWQVYGGERTMKAFERLLVAHGYMRDGDRAVPGQAAKLDAYGNISRGQIIQILSQLGIESGPGSNRAMARVLPGDNSKTARAKAE